MIKGLINRLKRKKNELQTYVVDKGVCDCNSDEETDCADIQVFKLDNFYKIVIEDYVSIGDYVKKMKSSDSFSILDSICNCVLWNNSKQKVNKGTYYVIEVNNCIYNICLDDGVIRIDERKHVDIDKHTGKNNITQERFVTFYIDTCDYSYFSAKHDKTGDTFYTRYYEKKKKPILEALYLSFDEASYEIKSVLSNLKKIDGIEDIVDINSLLQLFGFDDYDTDEFIKVK